MRAALLLALLAGPVAAQTAPPCYDPEMVAGWLRDRGFHLEDWGLNAAGSMEELWLGAEGWAVVATTPWHCASVVSLPDVPGGRLSPPMSGAGRLRRGEPT